MHMSKIITALLFSMVLGGNAKAQTVDIPDENFLEYLLIGANVDTNRDGEIQVSEAEAFTGSFTINEGITDLTGIEAFKNLSVLGIYSAKIKNLNLSGNTKLQYLNINGTPLTSVDVSKNTDLIQIVVQYNANLEEFVLGENSKLQVLSLMYNQIKSLNLDGCTRMTNFFITDNKLTTVDISHSPKLAQINISANLLTDLDLSNNKRLTYLNIGYNKIASLDISNNPLLDTALLQGNPLTEIDLSGHEYLQQLVIDDTKISSIDISSLPMLQFFYASYLKLKNIDASKNENLIYINAVENPDIEFINFKNGFNKNVFGFFAINSPNLKCIQVDDPDYSSSQELWKKDDATAYATDCSTYLKTGEYAPTKFNVYANPTQGPLMLDIKAAEIQVYNTVGQRVAEYRNTKNLDLGYLPSGVYFLKILDTSANQSTVKIIKK